MSSLHIFLVTLIFTIDRTRSNEPLSYADLHPPPDYGSEVIKSHRENRTLNEADSDGHSPFLLDEVMEETSDAKVVFLQIMKNSRIHTFHARAREDAYQKTEAAEHPYSVVYLISGVLGGSLCSGSLLALDWVLTAAHCVHGFDNATVFAGTAFNIVKPRPKVLPPGVQLVESKRWYVHPKFNGTGDFDLALIKLPRAFERTEYVKPISLSTAPRRHGDAGRCLLTAFGSVHSDRPGPDDFVRKTQTLEVGECVCPAILESQFERGVLSRFICTKLKQDFGACMGDSGGGLVCDGRLVAVTSFGVNVTGFFKNGECDKPGAADHSSAFDADSVVECGGKNTLSIFQGTYPHLAWIEEHLPLITNAVNESTENGAGRQSSLQLRYLFVAGVLLRFVLYLDMGQVIAAG